MGPKREHERALVERVLSGDSRARRQLVLDYHAAVRKSVGYMAHARYSKAQPADVEDAVQHVFMAVFANDAQVLARWQGTASLRTYLARVAEWSGGRYLGRVINGNGRFRLALDAPDADGNAPVDRLADDAPPVDARIAEAGEKERLRAAILAELSERGQVFYQALFIDDLSVPDIAKREGTNPNNVYQWKNRIMRVAQRILTENGYLGDEQ